MKQGDWPRAAYWAERGAHQPGTEATALLVAFRAAGRDTDAVRHWRALAGSLQATDNRTVALVARGTFLPLPEAEASQLNLLARQLLAEKVGSWLASPVAGVPRLTSLAGA